MLRYYFVLWNSKQIIWFQAGQPGWLSGFASAQGMILETRDGVPCRALCMETASPSACVSASLFLSLCVSHELINKI